MAEEKYILQVNNLKKYFPIKRNLLGKPVVNLKAVDDVSFHLKERTTIGVVGESGCGKTTLGRTILRLYETDGGSIVFDGDDITKLKPSKMRKYRTRIQLVFQDPYSSLPPRMTVGSIIAESVRIHKIVPKQEVRSYVLDIMQKCGLQPQYYDRYAYEFSGGQRQRICIARALAVKPQLVICDEPVSALDVSIQAQIINLLKELQETMGLTYVFISHDLSVVKYITDEILVMYLGNMMEKGETDELFAHPLHPYTKALFSAVPVPDPDQHSNRIILDGDIPSPANPPKGCKFSTRCSECMDVCRYLQPEYLEARENHFVACHLYNPEIMNNLEAYNAEYQNVLAREKEEEEARNNRFWAKVKRFFANIWEKIKGFFKCVWKKIKGLFKRKAKPVPEESEEAEKHSDFEAVQAEEEAKATEAQAETEAKASEAQEPSAQKEERTEEEA